MTTVGKCGIKKDGSAIALHYDLPAENFGGHGGGFGIGAALAGRGGDQRGPPLPGNQLQNRVFGVAGLIGEIDASQQWLEQPTGKEGDHDMRSLQPAVRRRRAAGLYSRESELAVVVGLNASEA